MGSYKWGCGVPFRVPSKGSIGVFRGSGVVISGVVSLLIWVITMVLPGGSWVVISGVVSPLIWVISKVTIVITHTRGLITPLITTHEPPSRAKGFALGLGFWRVRGAPGFSGCI